MIPIKGYENLYLISENGAVFSVKQNKQLKLSNSEGYLRVGLTKDGKRKKFLVHRLVAINFIDNPKNLPIVNHKDSVKTNNNKLNLQWSTNRDNTIHWHNELKKSNNLPVGVEKIGEEKYRSRIVIGKKLVSLGTFDNKWKAGTHYLRKKKSISPKTI